MTSQNIPQIYQEVKSNFDKGLSLPLSFRKQQLRKLYNLLEENKELIFEAVKKDLGRPTFEANLGEVVPVQGDVVDALENFEDWAKTEYPSVSLHNKADRCEIRKQPKGVVLIISPWNYPVQLLLAPLVGAISAGCAALLKPSEISKNSAKLLSELIPKYLDQRIYRVILGEVPETTKLLELKFDHIFYTGSTSVGKIVMAAAAKHLTSVTLELGGKSPVIVDKSLTDPEIKTISHRIAWGKFINNGQTCIAPDYVLVHPTKKNVLVEGLKAAVNEYYTSNPETSRDYGRIISLNHHNRLTTLLKKQIETNINSKIILGGKSDPSVLFLEPTIVEGVGMDSKINPLMADEIFGPILPIIEANLEESLKYINQNERPLALYYFGSKKTDIEMVLNSTWSGGCVVNDVLMHFLEPALPFGGTGASGIGSYHFKKSFDAFTHERSTMIRSLGREAANKLRYPPYKDSNTKMMLWVLSKKPKGSIQQLVSRIIRQIVRNFGFIGWVIAVGLKESKTADLVIKAVLNGFRAIDTACQPKHYQEHLVGVAISTLEREFNIPREQLFVQTKFTSIDGQDPNRIPYHKNFSVPEQVKESFSISLKNLKVNYIDSLILHGPLDTVEDTISVWREFESFKTYELVKFIGVSNFYNLEAFKIFFDQCRIKPMFIQNRFYKGTNYDKELRKFCKDSNIIYQSFWSLSANPHILKSKVVDDVLQRLAKVKGKAVTREQVFYRYLMKLDIIPLNGTTNEKHMKEDIEVLEWNDLNGDLTDEEINNISELL
ncbi:Aldehyde dehydrogenase [Lobulomyces angularis]|nr:Aldehyde dehydrogenase [Lobulomyces angularis]